MITLTTNERNTYYGDQVEQLFDYVDNPSFEARLEDSIDEINQSLANNDIGSLSDISVEAGEYANHIQTRGIAKILHDDKAGWSDLVEGIRSYHAAMDCYVKFERKKERYPKRFAASFERLLCNYLLAYSLHMEDETHSYASLISDLGLEKIKEQSLCTDDFANFTYYLAQYSNKEIDKNSLVDRLRHNAKYKKYENDQFEKAVLFLSDFHLVSATYDDGDSAGKEVAFSFLPFAIFPIEIIALTNVLHDMSMLARVEHPLLDEKLLSPFPADKVPLSGLLAKIQSKCRKS